MRIIALLTAAFVVNCGDDSGAIDAAALDAPRADAPVDAIADHPAMDVLGADAIDGALPAWMQVTPNSVLCSAGRPCDTTTQKCCDVANVFMCVAPTASCDGQFDSSCDGPEDCGAQLCCATGARNDAGLFQLRLFCAASCPTDGEIVCHNHTECPSSMPVCCRFFTVNMGLCRDTPDPQLDCDPI